MKLSQKLSNTRHQMFGSLYHCRNTYQLKKSENPKEPKEGWC
jgi:hypothetical protein